MKELLKTFLPIYFASVSATAYNVVTVAIVSKSLGTEAVAATGVAATVMFLLQGLALGLASGFLSKISKDNTKPAAHSLAITLVFSLILSALTLLFLPQITAFLKGGEQTQVYLRVSVSGFLVLALYRLFESWLYALGKAKIVLWLSVLMLLSQVSLTYLFVAVWGLGVGGGALANVASFLLCGVASLVYVLKTQPHFLVSKQKFDKGLLKASLPLSFMQFFKGVGLVAVQTSVGMLGTEAQSAFTVCHKLSHLATDGATALNSTAIKNAKSKRQLIIVAVVFSCASGLLLALGAPALSRLLFKKDSALIGRYFYSLCPFLPALLLMVVFRARLVATAHPYLAMTEGIAELAVRLILVFFVKDFSFVPLIFGISWTAGLLYLVAVKK